MSKEARVLRVTMTVDFIIEEVRPDGSTNINGWPIEDVVEDWFKRGRINQPHASRSSHELVYGKRFLDYKLLTAEEAIPRKKRELISGDQVKIIGYHFGPRTKGNKNLIGSTGRVVSVPQVPHAHSLPLLFRIKTRGGMFYYTRDNLRALQDET